VLAAAKPLSVQAHPDPGQAREGFERENREGLALDAPKRNYRDPVYKAEILCALGPLATLCGFRKTGEICAFFEILSERIIKGGGNTLLLERLELLIMALKLEDLKSFLIELYRAEKEVIASIGSFIRTLQEELKKDFPEYNNEWGLCLHLSGLYPEDPCKLAPLFLNLLELGKGEAIFIPAQTLHAHIYGMSIELTPNSDNVVRGGLSSKHIDQEELLKILNFSEYTPEIMKIPENAPPWYSFPANRSEFTLSVMNSNGTDISYPLTGDSIVLIIEGSATVTENGDVSINLKKGESLYIPPDKSPLFSGTFTAYCASSNDNFR
jgi:mannose-6-phosphate isomerase